MGWNVSLDISEGVVDEATAWRGDSNCPHHKEYDTDGHGFSFVEAITLGDFDGDGITGADLTLPRMAERLTAKCEAIIPGAPK